MIRKPAVAGSFYPADKATLHRMVSRLLVDAATSGPPPKAMIVPHAGLIYSGPIAARAYARLSGCRQTIKRVVLIGPSHRVGFRGLAVSSADMFSTPLGDIPIDVDAVRSLQDLPFVCDLDQAHNHEHCLEVQLPFLQECLDDFKLVPVVAGDAAPYEVCRVIERLWGGKETLVVISSDLSHYHDYATACEIDRNTSLLIEELDYDAIGSNQACGKVAINGLLKWLRDQNLSIETIDLRNSGDTAGDHHRVVGYGAYVVVE